MRYHKLVRDRIPEIIAATGKTCQTKILDEADYVQQLERKLEEELAEYLESKSVEELADLLEVMEAVAKARGYDWQTVLHIQDEKRAARGGFEKRILLTEVK